MKYSPRTFRPNEYIGNKKAIVETAKWMAYHFGLHNGNRQQMPSFPGATLPKIPGKILLLSGPPGVGKTTAVRLLCNQYNLSIVEYNGSDDRTVSSVSDAVSSVCGSSTDIHGKATLLVFEEADGLTIPAAACLLRISSKMVRPIVCVCNNPYSTPLRDFLRSDNVTHIKYHKVKWQDMTQRIIDLFQCMGSRAATSSLITDIAVSSNGDMRRCIHLIKMASLQGIPQNILTAGKNTADRTYTPFEACSILLSRKTSLALRTDVASKEPRALQFVRKNYIPSNGDAKYANLECITALADAADTLSMAAIFDSNYELPHVYSEMATVLTGMHALKSRKDTFFFSQMPDDYSIHDKTESMQEHIDMIASSKQGLQTFSPRAVATELLPMLRHPDTLDRVMTYKPVADWFVRVGEEYGLDAMHDEADEIKKVAVQKSDGVLGFGMEGFRRVIDENKQPHRHIYFAEIVRETAFGAELIKKNNRHYKKRVFTAVNEDEVMDQPLDSPPSDEIKAKLTPAKPKTNEMHIKTLDGFSGGIAVQKQRKAPVRGPIFKEKDARKIKKITSFFSGGNKADSKSNPA